MHRKWQWMPAALAAAVMLSGCSRRNDLPSEAETEDRTTTITTVTETVTEDTDGFLDDAGTMLSDAVENGGDIVSDVIDGGETLISDAIEDGRDLMDATADSTTTETSR